MNLKSSGLISVSLFTVFYLFYAVSLAANRANYEFMLYIGVVILAIVVITWLHTKLGFHQGLLWLLSFWGMLHMAGGLMQIPDSWPRGAEKPVLYNLWLIKGYIKFDNFVHAYGFGVTTWLLWQIICRMRLIDHFSQKRVSSKFLGLLGLCVLGSMGLGAINEIVEFAATLILPDTNVGGYVNTGWDLIFNMFGALIAASIIYIFD